MLYTICIYSRVPAEQQLIANHLYWQKH